MTLVASTLTDIVTKVRRLTASPNSQRVTSRSSSFQNSPLSCGVIDTKQSGSFTNRKTAVIDVHYGIHYGIQIFSRWITSGNVSIFSKLVPHIVLLRANPQVIRVYAGRIIARMTDKKAVRYWTFKQGVTVSMGAKIISLYGKGAIPKFMCSSFPEPTRFRILRNINFFNKSFIWKGILFSSKEKVIRIATALVTTFMQNKASIRYIAKEKLIGVSMGLNRFISDRKSALSSFLSATLEYPTANRGTVCV